MDRGGRKKGKVRNIKYKERKQYVFLSDKQNSNKYIVLYLDVRSVARDLWSLLPTYVRACSMDGDPIHGSIHKSNAIYSRAPKRLFHRFY